MNEKELIQENILLHSENEKLREQLGAKISSDARSVYIASIHKMYQQKARDLLKALEGDQFYGVGADGGHELYEHLIESYVKGKFNLEDTQVEEGQNTKLKNLEEMVALNQEMGLYEKDNERD